MAFVAKLPEDARLPQLAVATDLAAMQNLLQKSLPGFAEGRRLVDKLEITACDYKPGRKCSLSYKLHVSDLQTGKTGQQILIGVMDANGGALQKMARMQNGALTAPEFVPSLHLLPEQKILLWGFPNDPKIKHLSALVAPERLRVLLHEHWSALKLPPEITLREVRTSVVKYAPQTRCTLRHVLFLETADGLQHSELVLYSKIFSSKTSVKPLFRKLQALWQAPVCHSGALLIPEPVICDATLNVIFQRGLQGRNVDQLLPHADLAAIAASSGAMLAQFHQTAFERLEQRSPEHELYDCEKILARLAESAPEHLARAQKLEGELRERFARLTPLAPAPLHGAFRLTQLLLVEDRLALIDFDDLVQGNPISEVGGFIAYLLYLPLKGLSTEAQCHTAIANFCNAYRTHAPWGLPQDALQWYTAAYLLCRETKKCLEKSNKVSKRDYEGMIAKLLALAEEIGAGRMQLE
ncbi:MAG: aminoglycoside phosphotransferase family protein [candidate division KSB1 bacterium]